MARLLNAYCVTSEGFEERRKWPACNETYRGGALPHKHRSFFAPGVLYRAPMFLATSFNRDVADDFTKRAAVGERVRWTFVFDPVKRCQHVNFIDIGVVKSEREFLFAPFSAFTVRSVSEENGMYLITVAAVHDNKSVPEDLPIAPWH
eukprot:249878-Prymnesium_polylepis.1